MPSRTQFVWLALAVAASVAVVCFPPLLEIEGRLVVVDDDPGLGMSTNELWNTFIYSSTPVGRDRPLFKENTIGVTAPRTRKDKDVEWFLIPKNSRNAMLDESYWPRYRYTTDTARLLAELALIAGGCGVLCSLSRGRPKGPAPTPPAAA